MINFDFKTTVTNVIKEEDLLQYKNKKNEIMEAFQKCDMIGWDKNVSTKNIDSIKQMMKEVKKNSSLLLVIGIGGSFLGSKALYDMFEHYFSNQFKVIYCGYSLSSNYLSDLLKLLKDKDFTVNVISKSGNTMEIKLAYNLIKEFMQEKYSEEEIKERIIITTGTSGYLYEEAKKSNYRTLSIPDDIGGRYSMMTDAHLFPLSFNLDIDKFIQGYNDGNTIKKEAYEYAITRKSLFDKNKLIENYVSFEPKYEMFIEWLKQLFGESEGKNGKGIFPVSTIFTRDLHSLGQFIQEGNKILFETFIIVRNNSEIKIDNTNLNNINNAVVDAVRNAHYKGDVAVNFIEIDELNEYNMGLLIKFFFYSAAFSSLLFEVNPFDQPGVEVYKSEIKKSLENLKEEG